MNCQEIEKHCLDYCDNNLSSELRGRFEEHLQLCEHCRALIALTNIENDALHDPVDIPLLAPDFNARLLDRIQAHGQLYPQSEINHDGKFNKYLFNRPYIKRSWALLVAALLLVLILPSMLNQSSNSNQHLAQNDINKSQTQYTTKLEKAAVSGSEQTSLDQGTVQIQSASTPITKTQNYGGSGVQPKIPNQEIPLANHTPQEPIARNGSNREASKAKLDFCLPASQEEVLKPYPENIPSNYQLVENNESNGQFIYLYRETSSNEKLNIIITPIIQQPTSPSSLGGEVPEPAPTSAGESDQKADDNTANAAPAAALLNFSTKDISSNNVNYNLTISGKLPQENIDAIASAITLGQK